MPTDPFENEAHSYLVLVNDLGQHSLWPQRIDVPHGWQAVHGATDRAGCLRYIEEHWTDLTPRPATPAG